MATKAELIAEAEAKGLQLTGKETVAELNDLLNPVDKTPATEARSGVKDEASAAQTASDMQAVLAAQPKVSVFVPLMDGEPKGTQLPVEINGFKMFVPKGVPGVEVPQSVAEIIWQSLGVYDEASAALRSQNDPSRPVRLDLQNASDKAALDA